MSQQEKPTYLILLNLIFAQLNLLIFLNATCVALIFTLATLFVIWLICHYLMVQYVSRSIKPSKVIEHDGEVEIPAHIV